MTYFFTFILAFCSLVYELLLGQTLSAFLGNTILRYSITIGLYMLSMGLGALMLRERWLREPLLSLQRVELTLSLLGGASLVLLFLLDALRPPAILFSLAAHLLIIAIGLLTGLEIPLLMELGKRKRRGSQSGVLGVDYLGAFAGTLAFAFIFYPQLGLTQSAFIVAALNGAIGMLLVLERRTASQERFNSLWILQSGVCAIFAICIWQSDAINELLLQLYLR